MPYQLPDGTIIQNPRRNRRFVIGEVSHPERNLTAWRRQGILAEYGIVYLADAPVIDTTTLVAAKAKARRHTRNAFETYLENAYTSLERCTLQRLYIRGNAAKRAKISEIWDWEDSILNTMFGTLQAINAATDKPGVKAAAAVDPHQFDSTKPATNFRSLL